MLGKEWIERVIAALWLVLLAGCVRTQDEPAAFRVFLPSVTHDCSWIVRHADYVQAVQRCEARVWREHVAEARVLMPGDCVTPEPEDYVAEATPEVCYEERGDQEE